MLERATPASRREGARADGATNALDRAFVYGGGHIDDLAAMILPGTVADWDTYTIHQDDMGNVVALADATGTIVERVRYDVLGTPTFFDTATGTETFASAYGNPYAFTGRRWDAAAGLYHYRLRQYDPSLGRFTTRDPIGIWGDPLNMGNGYAYTGGNPWSYVDPWGLQAGYFVGVDPGVGTGIPMGFGGNQCDTVIYASNTGQDTAEFVYEHKTDIARFYPIFDAPFTAYEFGYALGEGDYGEAGTIILLGGIPGPTTVPRKGIGFADDALRGARNSLDNTSPNTLAKADALDDMKKADESLLPEDREFYLGDGSIYQVPGSGTQSGKPYIGSTDDWASRSTRSGDGRDRSRGVVIDNYPAGDNSLRRKTEQANIDEAGGLPCLDNKRNEIKK